MTWAPSAQVLTDAFDAPPPGEAYDPSIASSTASSINTTVFSDIDSTQSSVASSISDDFRVAQDDSIGDRSQPPYCLQGRHHKPAHVCIEPHQQVGLEQQAAATACANTAQPASYARITSAPLQLRQHPRRCSLAKDQKPPPLVRQCERKIHFVENLVDSATQMVEVIWPLSAVPCKNEAGSGRGVLPLRRYIEETLRRSRTSYSTLQVALYYLVLIKPHIPKADFTQEQSIDCSATRALMCGRRMFLSALILASKYLQDRNYSAKAWSKMSGLQISEINSNERTFLAKVGWKLHIPEPIFKRWTDIVLRYTPNLPPATPGLAAMIGSGPVSWRHIIPMLTPDLDGLPVQTSSFAPSIIKGPPMNYSFAPPSAPTTPVTPTPPIIALSAANLKSSSAETTPTPSTVMPRFLEPKSEPAGPPTPALMRMGPLPTPQLTPSSVGFSTPAVSTYGSRRPSISCAMSFAQRAEFSRCAVDYFPGGVPNPATLRTARRPSLASASTGSSPESLMSDFSRSSRASSISSVTTISTNASLAPQRACLARQAACRSARLPPPPAVKEEQEGTASRPIRILDSDVDMVSSPEMASFSVSDKALNAPHKHSKFAPQPAPSAPSFGDRGRKRARPRGGHRRSELQEECRLLLEEELGTDLDAEVVDDDFDMTSPSHASEYAVSMLRRAGTEQVDVSSSFKEAQPPAALQRRESLRLPVQKNEGKKRTCCSSGAAMSISPAPRSAVV